MLTAKMDRSWTYFGELIFQFIVQKIPVDYKEEISLLSYFKDSFS